MLSSRENDYKFYCMLSTLNKLLILSGVSRYCIICEWDKIAIIPSSRSLCWIIIFRVFSIISSVLCITYYGNVYDKSTLAGIVLTTIDIVIIGNSTLVVLLAYIFQKRYFHVVTQIIYLNNTFSDYKMLTKASFKVITYNIFGYIGVCFILILANAGVDIMQNISAFFTLKPFYFTSYYVSYIFISVISITFLIFLCYLRMCFKLINEGILESACNSSDNLNVFIKLHDDVNEVLKKVFELYGGQILFVLYNASSTQLITAYPLIKYTPRMPIEIFAMVIWTTSHVIITFAIIFNCDLTLKEVGSTYYTI